MEHKVYKIKNLVNDKIYIGVTKNTLKYRFKQHSKAETYLGNAIRKYGIDNFSIDCIYFYDNEEDSYDKESEIVTEEFIKLENNYNQKPGGIGGWDESSRLKGNNSMASLWENDINWASKVSKNMSNSQKALYENGHINSFKGKEHTDEAKIAQGSANRGTIYIHHPDFEKSKRVKLDTFPYYINLGWLKGRKTKG